MLSIIERTQLGASKSKSLPTVEVLIDVRSPLHAGGKRLQSDAPYQCFIDICCAGDLEYYQNDSTEELALVLTASPRVTAAILSSPQDHS